MRMKTKDPSKFGDDDMLSESFFRELIKNPLATKRFIAKHVMPELHQKTHFKSASSLYLRLPGSIKEDYYEKEDNDLSSIKDEGSVHNSSLDVSHSAKVKFDAHDLINRNIKVRFSSVPKLRVTNRSSSNGRSRDAPISDRIKERKGNDPTPLDPINMSKDVLLRCNILKPRNDHVKPLKRGQGGLASNV